MMGGNGKVGTTDVQVGMRDGWKRHACYVLIGVVVVGALVFASVAMLMISSRGDDGDTGPSDVCDLPARPAFYPATTAYFVPGMVSEVVLQGVGEEVNTQDRHMQVTATCTLYERKANGATVPVRSDSDDDDAWTCAVSCAGSGCEVRTYGVPAGHGLYTLSVTAQRAGCIVPAREVDTAMRDLYIAPSSDGSDTDEDGTVDALESCPTDPGKTQPGACGCGVAEHDTDGDGTPDCIDQCPDDADKTAVGHCGCGNSEDDTDNDGRVDCLDGCPTDPAKVVEGICGCGVPDTDTDGDGTMDCHDGCPSTRTKTSPGICGCDVSDVDQDGDGVPDCNDNCPGDSAKLEPGICGCHVLDKDYDGDGVMDCDQPCEATPAGCSIFTSPLTATPQRGEPGATIALSVDVVAATNTTCSWSMPPGWTHRTTPTCSAARITISADATPGTEAVIAVSTSTNEDGAAWQAVVAVGVASPTNLPPSPPVVSITPAHPQSGDTMQCMLDKAGADPDGDHVDHPFSWTCNNKTIGAVGPFVAAGVTSPGDWCTCSVFAWDGQHKSAIATASAFVAKKVVLGAINRQAHALTVPAGATKLLVKIWGGGGGGGWAEDVRQRGGPGGYTVGTLTVQPGDHIEVVVGEGGDMIDRFRSHIGGWPGGGMSSYDDHNRFSGQGGGYTRLSLNGVLAMVAGGGGGAGGTCWSAGGLHGGAGGGEIGGAGGYAAGHVPSTVAGQGGTQHAGGAGGVASHYGPGEAGKQWQGGHGGFWADKSNTWGWEVLGGGGGGGYYGGGSGSRCSGGGGGSSYINDELVQDGTMFQATQGNWQAPGATDPDLMGFQCVAHSNDATAGCHGLAILWFQ